MHDGGGNGLQTLLALPKIIDGIRAKGLQIVPVYQLIGKSRAEVMPSIPANQRWAATLNPHPFLSLWIR